MSRANTKIDLLSRLWHSVEFKPSAKIEEHASRPNMLQDG